MKLLVWSVCLLAISFVEVRAYDAQGFIRVCNGKFADAQGRAWTFAGWNAYTTIVTDALDFLYGGQPDKVTPFFQQANSSGLTAVRVFGHGQGDDNSTLIFQTSQGQYNERIFRSMDYVFSTARTHNVRVLISFMTNWQYTDGPLAYANWANLTDPKLDNTPNRTDQFAAQDQFWTNTKTRSFFKAHMQAMFNRNNTFNGIAYKDDWAIFGWGLYNEPRCPASQNVSALPCTTAVTNWANEMFTYAHQNNPKQLFTVGEEGFSAKDGSQESGPNGQTWWQTCNPAGDFSTKGQDFYDQHQKADFAEFHLWPTNWNSFGDAFANSWIKCHAQICALLKMPCVLGEFGRAIPPANFTSTSLATVRDPYFSNVYATIQQFAKAGSISGDMFWQWVGLQKAKSEYSDNDIKYTESTFANVITPHANWMKTSGSGAQLCPPKP